MSSEINTTPSRRDFLNATGAAVAAATLPFGAAAQAPPKFRRRNVMDPAAARDIDSYKKAIRAMLKLPPGDARNWYRNALTHTIDCPHGNWWFLVWHRGYTGWFEQIVREMSGDPQFALPYWDWTTEPRVPAVMYEDVLTPNDSAFIAKAADFKSYFEAPVNTLWKSFNGDQVNQLLNRALRFPADLWFDINDDPRGVMFFEPPIARGLTKEKPGLDIDADTLKAVSLPTLLNALSPRDFLTFGSPKTFMHSGLTGFGVLEGQPHNLVHNTVGGAYSPPPSGGFMQSNLSPVDPLFFLHHANIDRLWDVWTRKQLGFGLPALPQGGDLQRWSGEQFLFFSDAKGQPVTKTKAGDYAEIGDFNYDYQPGSGEEVVPAAVSPVVVAQVRRFNAVIASRAVTTSAGTTATASAALPADALDANAGSRLFAKVTLSIAPAAHAQKFRVTVDDGAGGAAQDAGVFAMFGHHTVTGPITFTVPLAAPVSALRARNALAAGRLSMRVVSDPGHAGHGTLRTTMTVATAPAPAAEVESIVVEAH